MSRSVLLSSPAMVPQMQQWWQSEAIGGQEPPALPPAPPPESEAVPLAPEGEVAGGDGNGVAGPPDPSPPVVKTKAPAWQQDRFNELAGKRKEAEDKLREQEARVRALEAQIAAGAPPEQQALVEARARELAKELARTQTTEERFVAQAKEVVAAGKGAYGAEFDQRLADMAQALMDTSDTDSVRRYTTMVQTAMEVGDAHVLIHRLGGDLDEANRILRLDPVKQAIALTALRGAVAVGAAPVSQAPRPPTPVSGGGGHAPEVSPDDPNAADKLSSAEWHRRRQEQVRAKRGGRAA